MIRSAAAYVEKLAIETFSERRSSDAAVQRCVERAHLLAQLDSEVARPRIYCR
jgi:hypothetical protein